MLLRDRRMNIKEIIHYVLKIDYWKIKIYLIRHKRSKILLLFTLLVFWY